MFLLTLKKEGALKNLNAPYQISPKAIDYIFLFMGLAFMLLGLFMLLLFMLLGLFMLLLFMLVPPMFVFAGVIAGVGVLVGVEAVFAVFVVLVVFVVFVLSLPQPIPKAARASRVRRAKVLRIEFFSCNPKGQIVRELNREAV